MFLWLLSILIPNVQSTIINNHNTYINYDLIYQGNLDVFQNNSLRFSTALQDQYHLFNIDYTNSMYPCFEMCTQIPGCKGIFNLAGTCIGLSYLGEHPHTTILTSQSYRKVFDLSLLSNLSCYNRCGISNHFSHQNHICWCDEFCSFFNDCCSDYSYYCVDHCLNNNGGCSQLCNSNDFGNVNCNCTEGYFLDDDLITCHSMNSIVGRIYDNIHEVHIRNVSIIVSNETNNFTLTPNFHGEFMLHNLTDGNYNLTQIINGNCTQRIPLVNKINITIPTDIEYNFYNFCGLNCRCSQNYYLSECNYITGFGTCNQCDVCADTHDTIQNCTNISNAICELITTTQTSTETSTATTTKSSTVTTTESSTATITKTTTQSVTPTTTITITPTTTQTTTVTSTITYKILNIGNNNDSGINYQSISIVLAVLLAIIVIILVGLIIKITGNNRNLSISEDPITTPTTSNSFTYTDNGMTTYDNPVFEIDEPVEENTFYKDVGFESGNGYMDVAPTDENNENT
jgi:hypothetical protein